jgi:hypothetical protein
MPNYWNVYQTELKRRIKTNYSESKANEAWKESKKYAVMNELDILQKSNDIYVDIAYKVRKEEKKNLKIKEYKKREKVNNSDNEWNKFYYDYKDKNPDADLQEVRKAYNGNIQNLLRISEEDRIKKNKIKIATRKEEESHITELKESFKRLSTSIIQSGYQSGGFGSVKDTIRDGLKDLDKTCDDIYNEMVECYIESTRTKIMNNTKHDQFDNNYLLENNKIFLYVTDNDLFETMVTREIITQSEERIGTLVENPESFLVIYKDLFKFKDSSNEKSLAIKILKIFIHLGILGYGFKETPIIQDFFTNGTNVYYFNLNNLKEEPLQNLQGNLFQNQDEFVEFRNANASIFSQGYGADKNYYNFEYYHKDPDPNKFAKFRNIIKDTTKELNAPTRTNYTPMYITGAILAALAVVGINDIYRSITKKPNESSKR